jgi:O-antigen/teichoic acid export membrane protein
MTPRQVFRLLRNSAFQGAAQLFPLFAAVISLPVISRALSQAEFGFFTILLSAVGFFAVLDLGLGRAAVRYVSQALERKDHAAAWRVVVRTFWLLLLLSGVLALVLFGLDFWGAPSISITDGDRAHQCAFWISLSMLPAMAGVVALRACLEATEDFAWLGMVQAAVGISTYGLPLLILMVSPNVIAFMALIVLGRYIFLLALWLRVRSILRLWRWEGMRASSLRLDFLRFSGWLMLSNLVGAIIVYGDRAIVASVFPHELAGLYNVPIEFISRLVIAANALATVVFPMFSRQALGGNAYTSYRLLIYVFVVITLVPFFVLAVLSSPMINMLFGGAFWRSSGELPAILVIGVMMQCLNVLSLAMLTAVGEVRGPAVLYFLELPIYLAFVYVAARGGDLVWVAVVWSARPVVEFLCFQWLIWRSERPRRERYAAIPTLAGLIFGVPVVMYVTGIHGLAIGGAIIVIVALGVLQISKEWSQLKAPRPSL